MFQGGVYANVRDTKGTRYWYVSNPDLLLDKSLTQERFGQQHLAQWMKWKLGAEGEKKGGKQSTQKRCLENHMNLLIALFQGKGKKFAKKNLRKNQL